VKAVPMINDFTSRFMVFIQKKGLQTWGLGAESSAFHAADLGEC
jgi:hypothetical protein